MSATPAEYVFWASAAAIAYTYLAFPALVVLKGWLMPRPYQAADITPRVSMIIAAYNEQESIAEKLENTLLLDYPRELLEVIVASDGSTDGTNEIVQKFESKGIRFLPLPRRGKAAALNDAVAASTGEILVFSDADSMYRKDAIRALVRPLADPTVGAVAGDQTYLPDETGESSGERLYWDFDQALKRLESQAGNAIGATGAIYSLRRSLFQPVPEGVTDDFVTSTNAIAEGYRLVFSGDAVAYEPPASSNSAEFGRKVRIMTRGLQSVLVRRKLLNPFKYGFYSLQLFSHKILRRLMVFPLITLFLASLLLCLESPFYLVAAVGQGLLYSSALAGSVMAHYGLRVPRPFALPLFFCMVNTAAFVATWNLVRGHRVNRWETVQ